MFCSINRCLKYDSAELLKAQRKFAATNKRILISGAHSDFGLLTLLTTDQPGLQISAGDNWLDIELDPNCIVVNLGDELQRQEHSPSMC